MELISEGYIPYLKATTPAMAARLMPLACPNCVSVTQRDASAPADKVKLHTGRPIKLAATTTAAIAAPAPEMIHPPIAADIAEAAEE